MLTIVGIMVVVIASIPGDANEQFSMGDRVGRSIASANIDSDVSGWNQSYVGTMAFEPTSDGDDLFWDIPSATVVPVEAEVDIDVPLPEPVVLEKRPAPQPSLQGMQIAGQATHYGGGPAWGDKVDYNGQPLGCGGYGLYDSANPTIVAVSPQRYSEWPCGTQLEVCGPVGCLIVTRQDACPGCSANIIDLSESAHQQICGVGTCNVTIEKK